MTRRFWELALVALLSLSVSGCDQPKGGDDVRPVRSVVAEAKNNEEAELITGQIAAHAYVNAAFRLSGRVSERLVSVGSIVTSGQVLARLEDTVQKNALTAAEAEVAAAKASFDQAESLEKRASVLIQSKAVSQNDYDETLKQLKAARAQVQAAEAKARIAKEQFDDTQLKAEKDGIITEKLAEAGEVVAAGQPIVRLAENEARDVVFDMPQETIQNGLKAGREIATCLDRKRDVCAVSTVYEIAPDADPATRTYQTKARLGEASSQMMLGATVIGRLAASLEKSIQLPASALTSLDGKPALWIVDPATQTVALRAIEVAAYTTDHVVIANGVVPGERIVTAGVQALHQGQKVKLLEENHGVR